MASFSVQRDVHFERSSIILRKYSLQLQSMLRSSKIITIYHNIYKQLSKIQQLTNTEEVIFNHIDRENNRILWHHVLPSKNAFFSVEIKPEGEIVGVVAFRKKHILVKNLRRINEDYPNVYISNQFKGTEMSLLCLPVKNVEEECIGILEFYKNGENSYSEMMCKYILELCYWIGLALDQSTKSLYLINENAFASKIAVSTVQYFTGQESFEGLLSYLTSRLRSIIMAEKFIFYEFTKDGRDADIFTEIPHRDGEKCMAVVKRIRIKKNTIIRQVVDSKQIFNDEVEPDDPRIDDEIHNIMDRNSRIESVCAIPIIVENKVVAVFEIINKQTIPAKFPERHLKVIRIHCDFLTHGMYKKAICNHAVKEAARLDYYEELLITQLRKHEEIEDIVNISIIPQGFNEFSWVPDEDTNLSSLIYFIFTETCPDFFNYKTLQDFILAVRALHRDNLFHNFNQAFGVFHAVYALIKIITVDFDIYEKSGLLLAALVIYLDHRGIDENTLKLLNHPITKIYDDIVNYHIDLGIYLIEVSKLLDHLPIDDRNQIVKMLSNVISNLKYFNTKKEKFTKIFENAFNITNSAHRKLLLNFIFWGAVNSRHFKNFRFAKRTCENLYQEYFKNGDFEIAMGLIPLPNKDRKFTENIPDFELIFLEGTLLPYFKILKDLFPSTEPIYDATMVIFNAFRDLIELRGKDIWLPDESLGLSLG